MTRQNQVQSLNLQALAASGEPLVDVMPLQKLERLAQESIGLQPDLMVNWQAAAELRVGSTGQPDTWLHLEANTTVPMTCQRCMGAVQTPLQIDQWYRFVASEEIAMAEDDASEEDLLVMAPQFDLLALLEDELLMALPLVPMHEVCPVAPLLSAGDLGGDVDEEARPHPFAALAQLKKK
ncbi:MAG: DUF177 domain-containing protein [Vitreoscilla sp.]|nr:DUF177 domain-containing protein [Polaromonas sp.]